MASRFRYNAAAGRYLAPNGRFVTQAAVREALDAVIAQQGKRMATLAGDLRSGRISRTRWQLEMREAAKSVHLASAAAAKGGWAQMAPADYGRAGREIRDQYAYLERFAAQIKAGTQPLDGRFLQRAGLYTEAGRTTYHATERAGQQRRGMTRERNRLTPADHCQGGGSCVEETGRGWVAIGELIPIGRRLCRARCKCQVEYQ